MEKINADTFASDLSGKICEDNEPASFIIRFITRYLSDSETTNCENITAKTEEELKSHCCPIKIYYVEKGFKKHSKRFFFEQGKY